MMHAVNIINGPNLNLLGKREPNIYGSHSLAEISKESKEYAKSLNIEAIFEQSNEEGAIINLIQNASQNASGLIINAAGYTHTSIAIMDALLATKLPIIEIHLSNIYQREKFRHHSYISAVATGLICGFGGDSYVLAIKAMATILKSDRTS
jgi:3-dehydroquinate dehydratase-2